MNQETDVTIARVASDAILEQAYQWLCKQRKHCGPNHGVWDLRFHWAEEKTRLQRMLLSGAFRLSPLRCYCIDGEWTSCWEAADSLILKAMTISLSPLFMTEDYRTCTHLKDKGGVYRAVKQVSQTRDQYQHILKSDAYHYYESIDHDILLSQLGARIACPVLMTLFRDYCQRVEIVNGQYIHQTKGIPKGCPLSPLIAALYLKPLDDALRGQDFYVRFMDDWAVMVKTKHQLRKVIKLTHAILEGLKLKMHPDKTYFGPIKKGFDFLGVHFGEAIQIAKTCLEKHRATLTRRYAQGASEACIGAYMERWNQWCTSILKPCILFFETDPQNTLEGQHRRSEECTTRYYQTSPLTSASTNL